MKKLLFITLLIIATSCSTYTVTKESLLQQLDNSQSISKTKNLASLGTNYYSNHLSQIKCVDKNGNEKNVYPDKNTSFSITNAITGKSISLYFDTVYIENDSLKGLKSRIIGGKKSIALKDVSSIAVKTEN